MIKFETMDDYIAAQPVKTRAVLERMRKVLRKALPGADEVISYGMPAYKLKGKVVVYFAGWKEHYAIYPASMTVAKAFQEDLKPYEQSKGTIRFPLDAAMPVKLIERIAKYRLDEVAEKLSAKKKR